MKFNQPCFIRKNTPELIEYLQIIGYRTLHKRRLHLSAGIFVQPPNWYGGFKDDPNWDYEEIEDCGTNEDLFKAIAAISEELLEGQYIKADADFTVYCGDQAGNDLSRHLKKRRSVHC